MKRVETSDIKGSMEPFRQKKVILLHNEAPLFEEYSNIIYNSYCAFVVLWCVVSEITPIHDFIQYISSLICDPGPQNQS